MNVDLFFGGKEKPLYEMGNTKAKGASTGQRKSLPGMHTVVARGLPNRARQLSAPGAPSKAGSRALSRFK